MFEQVLSKNAKETLAILGKSSILKDAYLAGGTALALQIGHRYSKDFDFFTRKKFNENILVQRIKKLAPDFKIEQKEWRTILGRIKDIRFSLFFYDYPLIQEPREFSGVKIAGIKDLAPMKISAISDRGTKRDFIDLYFIVAAEKIFTIEEILKLYDKKFKALKENNLHILKSLLYFEDANKEKMPIMIKEVFWRNIKKFFEKEIKAISKKMI